MDKQKALVVLSGGQDSSTCLFWAKSVFDEVHAVTFDYNQRHIREIKAAKQVAQLAGVSSHQVIKIGPILQGRSPLTNRDEKLETYDSFSEMDKIIGNRVELTFVPMRNALFLTVAANVANCMGIDSIITGVCQADNANYPDCRQSFIAHQELTINYALGFDKNNYDERHVSISTPLLFMSKAESIKRALALGDGRAYYALAFTHTAYDGAYPPTGNDHATVLRRQGFVESGLPDPLVLKAYGEGKMTLPKTENYTDFDFMQEISLNILLLEQELNDA